MSSTLSASRTTANATRRAFRNDPYNMNCNRVYLSVSQQRQNTSDSLSDSSSAVSTPKNQQQQQEHQVSTSSRHHQKEISYSSSDDEGALVTLSPSGSVISNGAAHTFTQHTSLSLPPPATAGSSSINVMNTSQNTMNNSLNCSALPTSTNSLIGEEREQQQQDQQAVNTEFEMLEKQQQQQETNTTTTQGNNNNNNDNDNDHYNSLAEESHNAVPSQHTTPDSHATRAPSRTMQHLLQNVPYLFLDTVSHSTAQSQERAISHSTRVGDGIAAWSNPNSNMLMASNPIIKDVFVAQLPFDLPLSALQEVADLLVPGDESNNYKKCNIIHAAPHFRKGRAYDGCSFLKMEEDDARRFITALHKKVLFDVDGVWVSSTCEEVCEMNEYTTFMQEQTAEQRRSILRIPTPFSALTAEFALRATRGNNNNNNNNNNFVAHHHNHNHQATSSVVPPPPIVQPQQQYNNNNKASYAPRHNNNNNYHQHEQHYYNNNNNTSANRNQHRYQHNNTSSYNNNSQNSYSSYSQQYNNNSNNYSNNNETSSYNYYPPQQQQGEYQYYQ